MPTNRYMILLPPDASEECIKYAKDLINNRGGVYRFEKFCKKYSATPKDIRVMLSIVIAPENYHRIVSGVKGNLKRKLTKKLEYVSVKVPKDTYYEIKMMAVFEKRTITSIILEALEWYLNNYSKIRSNENKSENSTNIKPDSKLSNV